MAEVEVFYGYEYDPVSPGQTPISPAPLISVTQNPFYAGDNLIGYNYTVTLEGKAAGIEAGGNGISSVVDEIQFILHETFNKNGAILYVEHLGEPALRCIGSKVVSIQVSPTENLWVNYADYTVELEFNEVEFIGCDGNTITCPDLVATNYTPELIEPRTYKIKSFSDSWEFDGQEELYQAVGNEISNQYMSVTYTINAEGYHYFKTGAGDTTRRQGLIPAWEQAKNFCQDRLWEQANRMIASMLMERSTGNTACTPQAGSEPSNLFDGTGPRTTISIQPTDWGRFNEKIVTTASESDGTFGLTFTCLLKRIASNNITLPYHGNVLHTIETQKNVTDTKTTQKIEFTVDGKIQGLVPGGLHSVNPAQLSLQPNSVLLLGLDSTETKYDYARSVYEDIVTGGGDLTDIMKDYLGISHTLLGNSCVGYPASSNFSSNHSYSAGEISYTVTYDSEKSCRGETYFTESTMSLEDKTQQIVEIPVPGRAEGPVIQKLNVQGARRISLTLNGNVGRDCCYDFDDYATGVCNNNEAIDNILPNEDIPGAVLLENSKKINPLDGSFSVSRKWVYYDIP